MNNSIKSIAKSELYGRRLGLEYRHAKPNVELCSAVRLRLTSGSDALTGFPSGLPSVDCATATRSSMI